MVTVYTWPGNIPNADIDADSPLTADLFADIRDGISNVAERVGVPGTYSQNVENHDHDGVNSKKVSAANLSGQVEPRPECFGMTYYQPLGTAGEKALDVMDATPLFGFMCGPGSAGDWAVWANGMAANNSRNIVSGNLVTGYIYNGRRLGLTAERSNTPYGDRLHHIFAISPNNRLGTPHGFVSVTRYQGNGTSQAIAHGLGATPEFVVIVREDAVSDPQRPRLWAKGMASGSSPAGALDATSITAVGATTVSVGAGSEVNANTRWYTMLAVRAGAIGAERFGILEWAGNGSSPRDIQGLGFAPDVVFAIEKTGAVNWIVRTRYFTDDQSQNLNDGTYRAEGIYQLDNNGIRVSTQLNTVSENYIALCFKGVQRWG